MEIGQEEDANMVDEAEWKQFWSLAATLNILEFGQVGLAKTLRRNLPEDGESAQWSWKRLKKAASDAGNRPREDHEWRHDHQRHRTQGTSALSTAEAEYCAVIPEAVGALGMQSMFGTECTGSCLDGLQRSQGDCVKKRLWEDQTCRIGILVVAGGDQIGKSEHEEGKRRATFGRPLDEGKNRCPRSMIESEESEAHESKSGQQRR